MQNDNAIKLDVSLFTQLPKLLKTTTKQAKIVFTLSLLLGIQPITTDLYLPALPAITTNFGSTMAQAQFTLSALLLVFGLSQLFWGPVSDKFGRKPILLFGLSIFSIAAMGATWSASMAELIGWRCMQGLGMGAVVMCGRALVRDLYAPVEGVKVMSKGLSGLGVLACLSAPLGSLLMANFGLKVPLFAQAAFSLFALLIVLITFQETLTTKNAQALQPRQMLQTWLQILKHPVFQTFSAISSASYGVLFVFLSTSSFVFIKHFEFSVQSYGLVMLGMSTHYLVGTFLCRHMLMRLGMATTMRVAGVLTFLGALVMLVLAMVGVDHHLAIMLPFFLMSVGHGIHQPCGQTGAIAPFAHAAGTASALNGFIMMFLAFLTSSLLSVLQTKLYATSTLPMIYTLCFWAFSLAIIAWTAVQKHALK